MQLDRPGGARNRVVEFGAAAHLIEAQLMAALDPAGLPDTGLP